MEWKLSIIETHYGWDRAVIETKSGKTIAMVENLDNNYVKHIIEEHNKAISLARKEGADIAKEVYKNK